MKTVCWLNSCRLACAAQENPSVIIALTDPSLIAPVPCTGASPFPFTTITGTLQTVYKVCNPDGSTCWRYIVGYDESQLSDPATALTTAQISCVVCEGCLTTWVKELVGNDASLVDNGDGTITFTSEHGCQTTIALGVTPCVVDTPTVNLTINGDGCIVADVNISADGGNIISAHADGIYAAGGGGGGDAWLLLGNTGTVDGTNFAGTIDDVPYTVRVNNIRALRLTTLASLGIFAGADITTGHRENFISPGSIGNANYVGGGLHSKPNSISDDGDDNANQCCIVACGHSNNINNLCTDSAIVAGNRNAIGDFDSASFIGGGFLNKITGGGSGQDFIGAGGSNTITIVNDGEGVNVIGGGGSNSIINALETTITGGEGNTIDNTLVSFVIPNHKGAGCAVSGYHNTITSTHIGATIAGGINNSITDANGATICGGEGNTVIATGVDSTVAGGGGLTVADHTFAYQNTVNLFRDGQGRLSPPSQIDISAFNSLAFFGDVDLWLGNTGNVAQKLVLVCPNTDVTYAAAKVTTHEAQAQVGNINYVWPATLPTMGQSLKVLSVVGTVVTLEWA